MKEYRGYYICPHCEEKFEWRFVDFGFRKGHGEMVTDVFEVNAAPLVAQCSISLSRDQKKVLRCYCAHCQTPVEIDDTGDIPKELFA